MSTPIAVSAICSASSSRRSTSLDSRFWRSMRALVLQPGRLSAEYLAGRRQTCMPPITVFLLVNLPFFLARR
ncbi:MAG: DUF3667 domain-containing protein [Xanthomonadales bacterium]|nr:DUF3667 domain-containing protein [Xanthomonadales bacterium]